MFERLTERAREALRLSEESARQLGHPLVTPEHLILGLLEEQSGIAARVLRELDIQADALREYLIRRHTDSPIDFAAAERIPFTEETQGTLELSLREALKLGHSYIGTEHLLLATVSPGTNSTRLALEDQGVKPAQVRRATLNAFGAEWTNADPLTETHSNRPRIWERFSVDGLPGTRLVGCAKSHVELEVELGELRSGLSATVVGVTVQGSVDLPPELAGSPAQTTTWQVDADNGELIRCNLEHDEVRFTLTPPLPSGSDMPQEVWEWEFADDLGTDYGGFGGSMGMGRDGVWARTIGARIPSEANWLEIRYPVSRGGHAQWEWRRTRISLSS